jgi:hypothetical protein
MEAAFRRFRQQGRTALSGKYSTITGASPATATRDLVDLMEKGALVRTGELRHARYNLSVPLKPVQRVIIGKNGELVKA